MSHSLFNRKDVLRFGAVWLFRILYIKTLRTAQLNFFCSTSIKPLFHSSQKPTHKLAASAFKYHDWIEVRAACSVRFCDEWKRAFIVQQIVVNQIVASLFDRRSILFIAGGNSKTAMIATISPAHINFEETLSTLR